MQFKSHTGSQHSHSNNNNRLTSSKIRRNTLQRAYNRTLSLLSVYRRATISPQITRRERPLSSRSPTSGNTSRHQRFHHPPDSRSRSRSPRRKLPTHCQPCRTSFSYCCARPCTLTTISSRHMRSSALPSILRVPRTHRTTAAPRWNPSKACHASSSNIQQRHGGRDPSLLQQLAWATTPRSCGTSRLTARPRV